MTQGDSTVETTATQEDPKWLTPGVRGIGLASFLADAGHEVPTSLFPSLLITTLGASAAVLGLADGLAGLARLAVVHSPMMLLGDAEPRLAAILEAEHPSGVWHMEESLS